MTDLRPLPVQSVPLTQDGINELLDKLNKEPTLGTHVQDALRENPRRALIRLFDLTAVQRSIIENMPDSEVHRYVGSVLNLKFGSDKAPVARFDPDPVFSGDKPLRDNLEVKPFISCHCHVDVS
jgi:hypothetical protein